MKRLQYALALCALLIGCGWLGFTPGCGPGTIPAIVTGVSVVGELIDLFTDTIEPEYGAASDNCAEAIQGLPSGSASLTETSAACAQLTDAFIELQQLVQHYTAEKAPRSMQMSESDQRKLERWYEAKARVDGAL